METTRDTLQRHEGFQRVHSIPWIMDGERGILSLDDAVKVGRDAGDQGKDSDDLAEHCETGS